MATSVARTRIAVHKHQESVTKSATLRDVCRLVAEGRETFAHLITINAAQDSSVSAIVALTPPHNSVVMSKEAIASRGPSVAQGCAAKALTDACHAFLWTAVNHWVKDALTSRSVARASAAMTGPEPEIKVALRQRFNAHRKVRYARLTFNAAIYLLRPTAVLLGTT